MSSPSPLGAAKTEQNNNCHYLSPICTLPAPLQCAPQYIEIFIYHAVQLCARLRWSFTIYSQILKPYGLNNPRFPSPKSTTNFSKSHNVGDQPRLPLHAKQGSRNGATSLLMCDTKICWSKRHHLLFLSACIQATLLHSQATWPHHSPVLSPISHNEIPQSVNRREIHFPNLSTSASTLPRPLPSNTGTYQLLRHTQQLAPHTTSCHSNSCTQKKE